MKKNHSVLLICVAILNATVNFVSANEPVGFNYEKWKHSTNTGYRVNDEAVIVFRDHSSTCCGEYTIEEATDLANDEENILKIITKYETENQIEIPSVRVFQGKEGEYSVCYKLEGVSNELQLEILSEVNLKIKSQKFDSKKTLKCSGVVYEP